MDLEEYWATNRFQWLFFAHNFDGYWYYLDLYKGGEDDCPVFRLDWYSETPELIADSLRGLLSWEVGPITWND